MYSQSDFEALARRVSYVESRTRHLDNASNSTTNQSSSSTVAIASSFLDLQETSIGAITADAAWHTITITDVPDEAKAILLRISQYQTSTVTANVFKVRQNSSTNEFTIAECDCDLGSNQLRTTHIVVAPVAGTFDYYMDNDPDWTVDIYIQGYFI